MLSLDDPRWGELRHAYGPATDVPEMLRRLARRPKRQPDGDPLDPWEDLWSSLCHQSSLYTATYAAAPHIVEIAAGVPPPDRIDLCAFIGLISRPTRRDDPVPDDLVADYDSARVRARGLLLETLLEGQPSKDAIPYLLHGIVAVHGAVDDGDSSLLSVFDGDTICPSCHDAVFLEDEGES